MQNFKEIFANEPEYQHFKKYLTGLMTSEWKNYSQIAKCMVKSADASNIGRFMDNELWSGSELNDKRVEFMLQRTQKCDSNAPAYLVLDDTLDEHVGTLFEHIARHYDHCDSSYKLAQNPVTSHYVRGRVRFPLKVEITTQYSVGATLTIGDSSSATRYQATTDNDLVLATIAGAPAAGAAAVTVWYVETPQA